MEDNFESSKKDIIDFELWFKNKDYARSSYYLQQAEEKAAKGILAKLGLLGNKNTASAQILGVLGIPIFSADVDYNHPWSRNLLKQLKSIYSGNGSTMFSGVVGDLNPSELIDKALSIGYDADASEQKAEELASGVKFLLDSLQDIKNKIAIKLDEANKNLDQLTKIHKETALPIIEALADNLNLPEALTQANNIIDNGSVSNFVGAERLNEITGENSFYYSIVEGSFCLIALAILDVILRHRETSRYPSEEPKFKDAQASIKEQIERCINIGERMQSIESISSLFSSLS
jgi:hypothetical protein